jgi:tetratricopeptide (TPR) repeat protein
MARVQQHLATKPRDPQMRFLKGLIEQDSGKPQDAIATYNQLIQDYPELPEPYNNVAVLYAAQGQYDRARQALEMAIRVPTASTPSPTRTWATCMPGWPTRPTCNPSVWTPTSTDAGAQAAAAAPAVLRRARSA